MSITCLFCIFQEATQELEAVG